MTRGMIDQMLRSTTVYIARPLDVISLDTGCFEVTFLKGKSAVIIYMFVQHASVSLTFSIVCALPGWLYW